MWSQIELKISGKTVSLSNNCYPYKAYLQALLKLQENANNSHMAAQFFKPDDGDVNKIMGNTGGVWRYQRCAESKSFECEGSLFEDFFQTNRFLLNNTQVDKKLFRARQPFVIMAENDNKYKLTIEDINLKACFVTKC